MNSRDNYHETIAHIAGKTHRQMMQNGMRGVYDAIRIDCVSVTCGDTLQDVRNKLSNGLRRTAFDVIDSYI
jgi:hypothetical protein